MAIVLGFALLVAVLVGGVQALAVLGLLALVVGLSVKQPRRRRRPWYTRI